MVRSIYCAQDRHGRLVYLTGVKLAHSAISFAVKSSFQPSDLQFIPDGVWMYFHRPLAGSRGSHHPANGLPKKEAIETFRAVADFAIRFEEWSGRMFTEMSVLARRVRVVDAAIVWFVFTRVTPWVWTEEQVRVVQKWSSVREREDELNRWVDEATMWMQRMEEAVGVGEHRC